MSNATYWERRQVENMYRYMESAETVADQIANLYLKASRYLSLKADGIFEKYMTKHNLSEVEARKLLNRLQDKSSINEMLQKLKNSESSKEKQELITRLEAPAYQARIERLRQLQNQLDLVMQEVYQQEKVASTNFYIDLANEAYYRQIYDIQQRVASSFSFGHINEKQIDQVIHSNWSGKNYSKRIWSNTQTLAKSVKEELLLSLVTGRTERETSEIIANKFAQGASNARRLVRTESNYISTEMSFQGYEAAGIVEYQFLATLDLRTSQVCRELDGKIFFVKNRKIGTNCPPMHPWCRSTTVSVVDRELIGRMQRSAIDPSTGKRIKVPRTMTYSQWYEKYVMGNAKAELEETKSKNRISDRTQHAAYRDVLGDAVPKTLDDFQNMKYDKSDRWDFVKLDYQRRNELRKNPELRLPEASSVVLPEEKFTKYLLGGDNKNGLAKGQAFTERLGYDIDNWTQLREEISKGSLRYPAQFKGFNEFGERYEQKMVLYGKKDTPANVVVGWIKKKDGSMSMTSAYIKEVK